MTTFPLFVLLVAILFFKTSNTYPLLPSSSTRNHDDVVLADKDLEELKVRQERQKNVIDQLFESIQGILGGTQTTTPPLPEDYETKPSKPVNTLPIPIPIPIAPKIPAGTTNNGGLINQLVATASGITSGFLGAINLNTKLNEVPYLKYKTTPHPNAKPPTGSPPPTGPIEELTGPLLVVANILLEAATSNCNDIHRVLGQCKPKSL